MKNDAEIKIELKTEPSSSAPKRDEDRVVRILAKDIEGRMNIYTGFTKIKGVSWAISNALCKKLKLDKYRKIGSLTDQEIEKIVIFLKNPEVPTHMVNRQRDLETGEDKHLTGSDLELRKEFDIKRLRKIKSYRGYRHASKLPLRGQRTRGNFRPNRMKAGGIKKKKKTQEHINKNIK